MSKPLAVLIVEDSEDDALLVERELRRGGYEITAGRVETAAAMRAALAERAWDIVIADYSMPHFSGLAALRVLKASGLDLPFIIASGAIGEDVAVEAMRAGAHDYFMKDKLTRLVPAVERELREAQVRQERRRAEESLHKAHEELERRVIERTADLQQANEQLRQEIAERLRAEQRAKLAQETAEAASAAKDQFLAVLSHELRNPLTSVLLMTSILERREDLPRDVREDIRNVRHDAELEARIIDDLLDLTRIARGKLQFDFRPNDLHKLIRRAAGLFSFGDGAPIRLKLAARRHFVHGDAARLQQVFWNLLSNARKFTPAKGSITVHSANGPDGRIQVQVIDTGLGIDGEFLPRLFTAFEQASSGRSRQFGGLGLGLTICKAICDAHGGIIRAASAGRNQGTTFTFEMPTVAETRAPRQSGDAGPGPLRSLHILLVEDHELTRNGLARALLDGGHLLQAAASVQSALDLIDGSPFDLLISDLGLPDGTGYEIMEKLRTMGVRGIAISGYGMEEDIRRSHEAGFSEHLTKPIDIEKLEAAIRRVTEAPVADPSAKPVVPSSAGVRAPRRRRPAAKAKPSKPAKRRPGRS